MKFDVIVGNPPYQLKVGPKKTEPIWQKFVHKAFELCKEDGYVSLIHPSGWRSPSGRFLEISEFLMSKNLKFLSVNDFDEGLRVFGVGTNFDWYIIQNNNNLERTEINSIDGIISDICIDDYAFIPNGDFALFERLFASKEDEKVNILHSYSSYETRKNWISESYSDIFKFPCIYTITQGAGINLLYSSRSDKGHFGIPKVIWSNGLGTYPIVDSEGLYGMNQFSYAIIDDLYNLENIRNAMSSERFLKLMSYCRFTNNKYDYKVIGTFKKDFWKEFI